MPSAQQLTPVNGENDLGGANSGASVSGGTPGAEELLDDGPQLAANTKHYTNVINGLLDTAMIHANKVSGSPPEDPDRNHWKGEAKAFLDRARRVANKRLKGKTRDQVLKRIDEIARKAEL